MGGRLVAHFGLGSLRSHLRVTVFLRALIPSQHPIALPLRGDKTLAGVLVCLHQRRNLIQRALILGLDLHAGDDELSSVRVDVSDERGRHRCQYQAPWRNFPSPLPAR